MPKKTATFTYREDGKVWVLPQKVASGDENVSIWREWIGTGKKGWKNSAMRYNILGFRTPKKGEWYLSGSFVQAYKAPNDLSVPHLVVTPIHEEE